MKQVKIQVDDNVFLLLEKLAKVENMSVEEFIEKTINVYIITLGIISNPISAQEEKLVAA